MGGPPLKNEVDMNGVGFSGAAATTAFAAPATIVTAYGLNGIIYKFLPGVHLLFPRGEPAISINIETAIRSYDAIPNPVIYPAYASSFYRPIRDRTGNFIRDRAGNLIYYLAQLAGGGYKHTRRHKQRKQTRHRQQKIHRRTIKQRRRRIVKTAKKRRN